MATLVFPFDENGLIVDVLVGTDGEKLTTLLASGQPIPAPVAVRGLLDTGTNVTVVAAAVLSQLGITPGTQATTTTLAGSVGVTMFRVSLSITDRATPGAELFVHPDLHIINMPASLSGIDAVIGMDVLATCKTVIDGPQNRFSIEF